MATAMISTINKIDVSNKKLKRSLPIKLAPRTNTTTAEPDVTVDSLPHVKDIIKKLQEREKNQVTCAVPRKKNQPVSVKTTSTGDPTIRTIENLKAIDEDIEKLRKQIGERDKIIVAMRETAEAKDKKLEEMSLYCRTHHHVVAINTRDVSALPTSPSPPLCQGGLCWADDFANKAYHEPVYAQLLQDHKKLQTSYHELQNEHDKILTDRSRSEEEPGNAINLVLVEQIKKLKEKETSLLLETQELKEQNDLLEFRILELEECRGESDVNKHEQSSTNKDVWYNREDVSDSGVMSLPTSDDLNSVCSEHTDSDVVDVKSKIMNIIHQSLTEPDKMLFDHLVQLFQDNYKPKEDSMQLLQTVVTMSQVPKCKASPRGNKLTGIATVFPSADSYSDEHSDIKAKGAKVNDCMQESGIFEDNEISTDGSVIDWETSEDSSLQNITVCNKLSKGVQTESFSEGDIIEIFNQSRHRIEETNLGDGSGDLSLEILKLSEIQKRIELKGGSVNDKILQYLDDCGHSKHLKYYEERLNQVEDKLKIYESCGDTKDRLLTDRLNKEIILQNNIEQLTNQVIVLETDNRKLAEEKCEFEEAENDARFQCQRLESKLQEVINRKTELQAELQHQRSMMERKNDRKVDKLLNKIYQRNNDLEEQENETSHRINMMEAAMPALLAWNMFRMCQNQNITSTAVEQILGVGVDGFKPRTNEAVVFDKLQELINDQKKLKEEYERAEYAAEERERKLEEKIRQLEEKAKNDRVFIQQMTSDMNFTLPDQDVKDVSSLSSIQSEDLAVFNELQELAENEIKLKKRIEELERKENAYMSALQQADVIWAGMEEDYKKKIANATDSSVELGNKLSDVEQQVSLEKNKSERLSRQLDDEKTGTSVLKKELELKGKKLADLEIKMDFQISGLNDELAEKVRAMSELEVTASELREEVETLEGRVHELSRSTTDVPNSKPDIVKENGIPCEERLQLTDIDKPIDDQIAENGLALVAKNLAKNMQHLVMCEVCDTRPLEKAETLRTLVNAWTRLAELLQHSDPDTELYRQATVPVKTLLDLVN